MTRRRDRRGRWLPADVWVRQDGQQRTTPHMLGRCAECDKPTADVWKLLRRLIGMPGSSFGGKP